MIAALQFSIVTGISLFRLRYGLYLFVLFLAFSPRSLGVILGGGVASLSFVRMAFPILFGLFVVALMLRKAAADPFKPKPTAYLPVVLLLTLSIVKIVATVANGVLPVYALEDMLLSSLAFLCFYTMATERFSQGIINVMLIAVFLTGLIVTLERLSGQPLHFAIADRVLFEADFLQVFERGGALRVQAIFDNPLSLSEFAVLSLPVTLYFALAGRKTSRLVGFMAVGLVGWIILNTGSRSGILVGFITLCAFFGTYLWPRLTRTSRGILALVLVILATFAVASAFGVLLTLIGEAQNAVFYLVEDEAQRSTLSRALQYYQVYTAILERPLFGFGYLQNFSNQLEAIDKIDNYYLRVSLEGGLPALCLFIAFLVTLFRLINRLARVIGPARTDRLFHAMCIGIMAAFAAKKLFLSMPTNNIYFYALMGTFIGVMVRRAVIKGYVDAGSADTQ